VQRKYAHKRTSIKENDNNHHLKVYKCIRDHGGWDNWKMDIIGFHDCYDHYEARKIEQNYFETLHATLNSIEPLPKPKPRPIWYCDVCKTTCRSNKAFITHKETKKHKRNSDMNTSNKENKMETKNSPKVANKFYCEKCDYGCYNKSDYNKHLSTRKHIILINPNKNSPKVANIYECICGKIYKHASSLCGHKK
jgi:hypothetical protein